MFSSCKMHFSSSLSTTEDKATALEQRKEAERALNEKISRAISIVEQDEDVGCNFCFPMFFRRLRGAHSVATLKPSNVGEAVKAPGTAATASSASGSSNAAKRLFGKKKKVEPSEKLKEAAMAMQERLRGLEYRVCEGKREAATLARSGQKQAALRALKRAKAVEKQVA